MKIFERFRPKPKPCWMGRVLGWGIYIPPMPPVPHNGRIRKKDCLAPSRGYCRCAHLSIEEDKPA